MPLAPSQRLRRGRRGLVTARALQTWPLSSCVHRGSLPSAGLRRLPALGE